MPDIDIGFEANAVEGLRPTISVAIPTCNGARHLAEALRGVLAQEGLAFELVVSDDRSEDETLEVVRALAGDRARIARNAERLGLAGNWNRCVELATAPLIAILHQDDVWLPGHLADHVRAFEDDPAVGLVASASDVIDETGAELPEHVVGRGGLGPIDRTLDRGGLADAMIVGNPLRCSAVSIRRAAFDDVGGFDPGWRYALDWEFWLRVSRRWKVAWRARPTVCVRWHSMNETHRFRTGTIDLDEAGRMLEQLRAHDWRDRPGLRSRVRAARAHLARAYLNRAHETLRAGRADVGRSALLRAFQTRPALIVELARQPGLAARMIALTAAPRLAARLLGAKTAPSAERAHSRADAEKTPRPGPAPRSRLPK